ncbi:MAG TPA: tRNA uridine-5-carboxymethylaminomethyl(34) synthesis GTPase MnmE [Gammaproteobacteria bacterium]|nr:tRNA uridine-5-carboxymethylaminomethyl(34) synthesis GTPase MnmE [Gammaproteobacteria bacterium]
MNKNADTIAAIATPPGRGGIGIVRVSGPKAADIAQGVAGVLPEPRRLALRSFLDADGGLLDTGLVLYFAAPNSFTGEDVVELHGHGGPVVLDLVLQRVLALGARLARPGEFSERAFLNDKLDLAQAEAVADLIDSGTAQAARAAMRSLRGEFSARVYGLVEAITGLRAYVEAAIDFPDEEVDFLSEGDVEGRLAQIRERFEQLNAAARQGSLLRDGMTVVIAGRPNAGKSSLLNYLAGHEAAIVTDIPGTTRDLLREHVNLDGMPLHLVDTAGLRESGDPVEQEGVRRAKREMQQADRVLMMVDATLGLTAEDQRLLDNLPLELAVTLVYNKIDITGQSPAEDELDGIPSLWLSARTGEGMELLRQHLKQAAGFAQAGEGGFSARRRHLDALHRARQHLNAAAEQARAGAGELLAEDLRLAQVVLSEITGEFTSDDLLGNIFSSFCIGK